MEVIEGDNLHRRDTARKLVAEASNGQTHIEDAKLVFPPPGYPGITITKHRSVTLSVRDAATKTQETTAKVTPAPYFDRPPLCKQDGMLVMTLFDTIIKDGQRRTGYIASNHQLQFDDPPQAGTIYNAGFSLCNDGLIAFGRSKTFYACDSGNFSNLYDKKIAPYCREINLKAVQVIDCSSDSVAARADKTSSQQSKTTPSSVTTTTELKSMATPTTSIEALDLNDDDNYIKIPTAVFHEDFWKALFHKIEPRDNGLDHKVYLEMYASHAYAGESVLKMELMDPDNIETLQHQCPRKVNGKKIKYQKAPKIKYPKGRPVNSTKALAWKAITEALEVVHDSKRDLKKNNINRRCVEKLTVDNFVAETGWYLPDTEEDLEDSLNDNVNEADKVIPYTRTTATAKPTPGCCSSAKKN